MALYPSLQTFTVAPEGHPRARFSSVKAAVDAANAVASDSNRIVVDIAPGLYVEDPITVDDYVTVQGHGQAATIISPTLATQVIMTAVGSCRISDLRLTDADGVGGVGLLCQIAGGTASIALDSLIVTDCETCYNIDGTGAVVLAVNVTDCAAVQSFGSTAVEDGWNIEGGAQVTGFGMTSLSTQVASRLAHGFHVTGPDTNVLIRSGDVQNCDTGALFEQGCTGGMSAVSTKSCDIGFDVLDGLPTNINLSGCAAFDCDTYDLRVAGALSTVIAVACIFDDTKLSLDVTSNFIVSNATNVEGDQGFSVKSELFVGTPERGTESAFGEGDMYVRGMRVFTDDGTGTNFIDVTTEAMSYSGSTFSFQGIGVDNAIYLTTTLQDAGGYKTFLGNKAVIETAAVLGGGNIIAEYWNGANWVEFNIMVTNADSPYLRKGKVPFLEIGNDQNRYNPLILADWAKNDPPSLGFDAYWIRYRISSAITTAPVMQQFKVHSNHVEINADGYQEFYGLARIIKKLPMDSATFNAADSSPGNGDVYATATLGVGRIENLFTNNASRKSAFCVSLTADIDTSAPILIRLHQVADATGDVEWEVAYGFSINGDEIGINGAPGAPTVPELATTKITTVAVAGQQYMTDVYLDISTFAPALEDGPLLWVALVRDATGGNPDDTLAGDVALIQVTPYALSWNNGAFIASALLLP